MHWNAFHLHDSTSGSANLKQKDILCTFLCCVWWRNQSLSFPSLFFFFNQMYRKENCPHFFKNPSSSNPLEVLNHFFLLISLSCYIGWGTRVCWTLAAASSWVLTAPKSTEDWWWQVLPCEAGLPVFHRSKGRPGGGAMILITWWLWLQWRQPKATLGGWHL